MHIFEASTILGKDSYQIHHFLFKVNHTKALMFTYAKKSCTTAEFIIHKKTTKIKQNMSGIMSTYNRSFGSWKTCSYCIAAHRMIHGFLFYKYRRREKKGKKIKKNKKKNRVDQLKRYSRFHTLCNKHIRAAQWYFYDHKMLKFRQKM